MRRRGIPRFSLSRRQPVRGLLAGLAGAALLAGCAQIDGWAAADPPPERVLSDGFRTLAERYIQTVDFRKHATSGLVRLADLDPDLDVAVAANAVRLSAGDTVVGSWPAPDPFDPEGWADLAARFIAAAQAHSKPIRARSEEDIYTAVFDGTLAGLDRYTRYSSARVANQRRAARDGFGGLGISINSTDGRTIIVTVFPGMPAARAGLQPNDVITHVGDKAIGGLDLVDVVGLLRGPIDSRVDLTVERRGTAEPMMISVSRARIVVPTVASRRDGALLVVAISGFNQGTAAATRHQISRALREEGTPVEGIVLDLRGNPGGLLDQSVRVADLFLNDGPIIRTKGRHRNSDQEFDATWGEVAPKLRLAVLVNGRSASASEIVAAALSDRGRAVVLGSSSYGKGTVQTIIGLPNGGELTLTWARMISPGGYWLQDHGVFPAVCTNGAPDRMDLLRRALAKPADGIAPFIASYAGGTGTAGPVAVSGRDACPPNPNEPATDLDIARLILRDKRLYDRMLHRSMAPMAAVGAMHGSGGDLTPQ